MSLEQGEKLLKGAETFINKCSQVLAQKANANGKLSVALMDKNQGVHYDLAWIKSEEMAALGMIDYGKKFNGNEEKLALFFIADALLDIQNRMKPHLAYLDMTLNELNDYLPEEEILRYVNTYTNEEFSREIVTVIDSAQNYGNYDLNEEQQMMFDTFRAFAEDKVKPIAEKVHREDLIIPDEIINGLAEMGCFGLSIADTYGGFQSEDAPDHTSMAIVTEELSRGSVGVAGSLITRPEIVSKAIASGGTEEQKQKWLNKLATGEILSAVAVTEPDFGSDVAGMKVTAKKTDGGWLINGTKTWCTFAGKAHVMLVLARTESDPSLKHKGLSLLLAEKPTTDEHEFKVEQSGGGICQGKAIATIGYRGMHSYEVSFEDYLVPEDNLIGGEAGRGKGFYLQMQGFAGGRLQTAARATGVMQAALETAMNYTKERKVFGKPIVEYGLSNYKLARMAAITMAVRQMTYLSARLMDEHKGQMEASLVKFYSCKISEWIAREAMQLHGGMGYAEEYEISRLYVDARVFSIFEGAEDILALRVIARSMLTDALKK